MLFFISACPCLFVNIMFNLNHSNGLQAKNFDNLIRRLAISPWKFYVFFTLWRLFPWICRIKCNKTNITHYLLIASIVVGLVTVNSTKWSQHVALKKQVKMLQREETNLNKRTLCVIMRRVLFPLVISFFFSIASLFIAISNRHQPQ